MDASRHRTSSLGARLPLPAGFFAPVACNDAQAAALQSEADKLVRDAVRNARWEMHNEDSSRGWKLASSRKHFRDVGVRSYMRRPELESAKSRRIEFKCMGVVTMPLDLAMETLYADTTADCRHNASMLIEGCLDAAVLHAMKRKTDSQPYRYLGINWIAVKNSGMFAKKRDVCFLKCSGTTFDENREEIGYIVARSIDVKECPPMDQSHGLTRTNMSTIMLLKESPDGRSTTVIWQGTLPLSSSSPSKLMDFVHANFMSVIGNLNVFSVTRYLTRETDHERFLSATRETKSCHLCNKKFSLLRSRHHCNSCGQMMCRDCEVTRKTTSLDREVASTNSSFAEKDNVRRYCKRCMVTARRKAESAHAKPMMYDFTNIIDSAATTPVPVDKQSERMSSVSSTGSQCSIQLTWPDLSKPSQTKNGKHSTTPARHSYAGSTSTTPTYAKIDRFSMSSHVPVSPLSIKTKQGQQQQSLPKSGRERLETDPWEYYDAFEASNITEEPDSELDPDPYLAGRGSTYSNGGRGSTYSNSGRASTSSNGGRASSYSNPGSEVDLATRLWEMSRKAQETLDTTRRNSCMMSETGSAPRSSEQFQQLDKSIAEQADLLNVIGFVSTGRVYMETGEDENGEHSGVRISETSIPDGDRFEILT